MKKCLCLVFTAVMLVCLFGCKNRTENTVSFYFLRQEYTAGAQDSVIAPETRDISGHQEDLNFLLQLYLGGPLEDTLRSPFPTGTRLVSAKLNGDVLTLILSPEFSQLENIQLTLSGACIASTCFNLTNAASVEIFSGESGDMPLITMTRDSLTLLDDSNNGGETTEPSN